jgi:phage head maturation protease
VITGYAVLWGVWGLVITRQGVVASEMIRRGAFKLDGPVQARLNHRRDRILGSTARGTLRLSEDARGIRFELDRPMPEGCTGCSFNFKARRWVRHGDSGFELTEGVLTEISLITRPGRPVYAETLEHLKESL